MLTYPPLTKYYGNDDSIYVNDCEKTNDNIVSGEDRSFFK